MEDQQADSPPSELQIAIIRLMDTFSTNPLDTPPKVYHTLINSVLEMLPDPPLYDSTNPDLRLRPCFLCADTVPAKLSLLTKYCADGSHTWCGKCLWGYFSSMFSPGSYRAPVCCGKPIPFTAKLRDVLLSQLESYGVRFPQYQRDKHLEGLKDVFRRRARMFTEARPITCHSCGDWVEQRYIMGQTATCPSRHCCAQTCTVCQEKAHNGAKCPNITDIDASRELLETTEIAECPMCKIRVQKSDGCNHITCNCGTEFCFKCDRFFNEGCGDHMMRPDFSTQSINPENTDSCSHIHWVPTAEAMTHSTYDGPAQLCIACGTEHLSFYRCASCGISGLCQDCRLAWRHQVGGPAQTIKTLRGKVGDLQNTINGLRDERVNYRRAMDVINLFNREFITDQGKLIDELCGAVQEQRDIIQKMDVRITARAEDVQDLGICLKTQQEYTNSLEDKVKELEEKMDGVKTEV